MKAVIQKENNVESELVTLFVGLVREVWRENPDAFKIFLDDAIAGSINKSFKLWYLLYYTENYTIKDEVSEDRSFSLLCVELNVLLGEKQLTYIVYFAYSKNDAGERKITDAFFPELKHPENSTEINHLGIATKDQLDFISIFEDVSNPEKTFDILLHDYKKANEAIDLSVFFDLDEDDLEQQKENIFNFLADIESAKVVESENSSDDFHKIIKYQIEQTTGDIHEALILFVPFFDQWKISGIIATEEYGASDIKNTIVPVI